MSEKREKPLSIYSSHGDGPPAHDAADERGLKALFQLWSVPKTPARLDWRIIESYRQQILEGDRQEVFMKQCPTCQEEFANKFSFCPVDGTPLDELTARSPQGTPDITPVHAGSMSAASMALVPAGAEYHLTFMDDTGLTRRLMGELKEVAHNSELTWPEFKRDPFGYSKRFIVGYSALVWRFFSSRNVAIATSTALLVVLTASIGFVVYGRYAARRLALETRDNDLIVEQIISPDDIPDDIEKTKPDEGIGTGKGGRVGFNKGAGEGSLPKPAKAGGGGGGGQQQALPTQQGRIPPPSEIPALIPTTPPVRPPQLPVAGINIDPALYKNLPYDRFGDPRSKSTATSAGPGSGNGLGNGTGAGIGEGDGQGFGPGRDKNMGGGDYAAGGGGVGGGTGNNGENYNRTFSPKEVNVKARILSRPEPQYTEEARKNQVSGTVVLRAVFSSSGQVTNIRAVSSLPYGLTERAIAAARQIRFTPAMKDGRAVSQYIQIEYNFNLY
ncbi:MAG TPA: energy transducer TonB [Pyrinomonadaceae bacterium]|nr:energy transducer TonB [Pyrinomonadaceae bacterium]